jgi:2'-5' RNA ligase
MNDTGVAERGDSCSGSPNKLRAFIALPIPEAVKDQIERVQTEMRDLLPRQSVRWTKRDQFHLTLRFLGDVEAGRVRELTDALHNVCSSFRPLQLHAERIGCFPDLRFPRIVWVWVHAEAGQLAVLQARIEAAVGEVAERKPEKKFTGHVTIARLNAVRRLQAEALAGQVQAMSGRCFGEWTASEVKLMQSELFKSGAVHTVLAAFPLNQPFAQ